jgi:hypothetical protein
MAFFAAIIVGVMIVWQHADNSKTKKEFMAEFDLYAKSTLKKTETPLITKNPEK